MGNILARPFSIKGSKLQGWARGGALRWSGKPFGIRCFPLKEGWTLLLRSDSSLRSRRVRRVKLVRKCPWRGPSSTHYWLLCCDIRRRYPHDKDKESGGYGRGRRAASLGRRQGGGEASSHCLSLSCLRAEPMPTYTARKRLVESRA